MKEIIHFAHGNGFPSGCYRQLLNALQSRYECHYIDRVGHNPHFPVTDNWDFLVKEVLQNIRHLNKGPVIGVGHSLGGVLTFLAAIEQPQLFKAVIMIDSPLLNRAKSLIIKMAKQLGKIDQITPAHITRGRRKHWSTREELLGYLKDKPLFKTFNEACLEDYIDYGFEQLPDGYHLRFNREIEYSIFRTLPHQLPKYEGKLRVPTALIYGDKSNIITRFDIRYMEKNYGIKAYCLPGTHMLPMEHPKELAQQIFKILDAIL